MSNEAIDNGQQPLDDASARGELRALQIVRAGSVHFGIFVDEIAAIVAWREPTPLPHAPKSVRGVVGVQGRMLTVLELAALAGREVFDGDATLDPSLERGRHIIALRGDEQLALAVDALGETIQVADRDLKPKAAGVLVLGVIHLEAAEINVLNVRELFPTAIQGRERRRRRF